jgi:hypothetical protein
VSSKKKEQGAGLEYVFENLRENKNIGDKIDFGGDWMMITFNEYLYIHCCDDCITINDGQIHWHPIDGFEMLQWLSDVADLGSRYDDSDFKVWNGDVDQSIIKRMR